MLFNKGDEDMNNNEGMFDAQSKRIRMPICDRMQIGEVSNDYTLPDYQAEIRRLLCISANAMPPAKYVSTSGAEFNGVIDYSILYVGADGELYTLPLSCDYEFSFPIDADNNIDFNEGVVSCADIVVENITTRISGPRKLTIKCRLKCLARAYAVMVIEEKISASVDSNSIQRLSKTVNACNFMRYLSEPFSCSAEIIPESANMRVIGANGKIFVTDTAASDGSAEVRGEVYVSLLAQNDDNGGTISQIQRKIPFSQLVVCDDMTRECKACAFGCINNIVVTVEDGRIIADIDSSLEVEAQGNVPFSYTEDVYSTEYENEALYRDYRIPTSGYCINGNFSINERLSKESLSISASPNIIDCYANAMVDTLTHTGTKGQANGQIKITFVLNTNGEYSTVDTMLPLKYEFDASKDISSANARFDVISCKTRQDAESISIDAEIAVCARGNSFENIIALDEVRFTEKINRKKGDITICYPSKDDTLWSISKRYHVPMSRIQGMNALVDDISDKNYLII